MQKPKTQVPKKDSALQTARRDPGDSGAPGLFRHFDRSTKVAYKINDEAIYVMHALTAKDREDGKIEAYRPRLRDGKKIPVKVNTGYHVKYTYDKVVLEFIVAEGLEWLDLKVYKGLLAMAYANGKIVDSKSTGAVHQAIFKGFDYTGDGNEFIFAIGSYRDLARAIGYTGSIGGSTILNIKQSIARLQRVQIVSTTAKEVESFSMISYVTLNITSEQVTVGLNPRVVECLKNGNNSGFTHLDLTELRQIDCAVTGLIHAKLEALIGPGKSHTCSIESLFKQVWGEPLDMASSTHRMRLPAIRVATSEIGALGWDVAEYRTNYWRFTRPSLKNLP
jgi:hypothetical protein